MKIFTQFDHSSENIDFSDKFRKTVLFVLFISLAITALADSVQLFNDLSSAAPYFYGCETSGISYSTSAELY